MHAHDALYLVMTFRTMNLVAPCHSRLTGCREPLSMDDSSSRLKMVRTVPARAEAGCSTFRAESGQTVRHPPVALTMNIASFLEAEKNVWGDPFASLLLRLPSMTPGKL